MGTLVESGLGRSGALGVAQIKRDTGDPALDCGAEELHAGIGVNLAPWLLRLSGISSTPATGRLCAFCPYAQRRNRDRIVLPITPPRSHLGQSVKGAAAFLLGVCVME